MISLVFLTAILSWPGGEIPYRFDASVAPPERADIGRALSLWTSNPVAGTGHPTLGFREVPDSFLAGLAWEVGLDQSVLIRVDSTLTVFARTTLGSGPHRELVFNPARTSPDWIEADLAHEWGHVLGLTHEHQRRDRDRYIAFPPGFLKALSPDRQADYALDPADPPAGRERPYDIDSLMHYSSNIDGNRMVRRSDGTLVPGHRGPSPGDWARLAEYYPPPLRHELP